MLAHCTGINAPDSIPRGRENIPRCHKGILTSLPTPLPPRTVDSVTAKRGAQVTESDGWGKPGLPKARRPRVGGEFSQVIMMITPGEVARGVHCRKTFASHSWPIARRVTAVCWRQHPVRNPWPGDVLCIM